MKSHPFNSTPRGQALAPTRFLPALLAGLLSLGLAFALRADPQDKPPATQAQPVDLSWKLKPGMKIAFLRDQRRQSDTLIESKFARWTLLRNTHQTLTVESLDKDGAALIRQRIDRITYKKKPPVGNMIRYDTAAQLPSGRTLTGELAQIAESSKRMVGLEFTYKLSPAGRVSDLALTEASKKAIETWPPAARTALTTEALSRLTPAIPLPAAPSAPAATWRHETPLEEIDQGLRRLWIDFTYQGPKVEAGKSLQNIAFKADLKIAPPKTPPAPPPAGATQPPESKIRQYSGGGSLLIDPALGYPVKMSRWQVLDLAAVIEDHFFDGRTLVTETWTLQPPSAPGAPVTPATPATPGSPPSPAPTERKSP